MEMKMRLTRVSAVPARGQHLTALDAVAHLHLDGPLAEVREQRVLTVLEVEDDVVAGRVLGVHVPRLVVLEAVHRLDDEGFRRSHDRPPNA